MKNAKWKKLGITTLLLVILIVIGLFAFTYIYLSKPWISEKDKTCGFGGCRYSEVNNTFNHWLDQAILKRDPELCNNVTGLVDGGDLYYDKDSASMLCKASYGGRTRDIDYCHSLPKQGYTGSSMSDMCFRIMLQYVEEVRECYRFPSTPPNSGALGNLQFDCFGFVAVKKKDVSICDNIPTEGYRTDFITSRSSCYGKVAYSKRNALDKIKDFTEPLWGNVLAIPKLITNFVK